jgi:hypothetical protein
MGTTYCVYVIEIASKINRKTRVEVYCFPNAFFDNLHSFIVTVFRDYIYCSVYILGNCNLLVLW